LATLKSTRCRCCRKPNFNGGINFISQQSGGAGYEKYKHDFNKLIWKLASPQWQFDDATFDRSAESFNNPDHVQIVIHNYRWRLGLAEGESKYDELEKQIAAFPAITVPTITLESDANGAPHPDPSSYAKKFSANIRTARSKVASGTTCRKKRHGSLLKLWSKLTVTDHVWT
jgi:hypothetical protein